MVFLEYYEFVMSVDSLKVVFEMPKQPKTEHLTLVFDFIGPDELSNGLVLAKGDKEKFEQMSV